MISFRQLQNDADVVIVGAGPAGSSAAIQLARCGLRVILVDQHHFPRDKVCGDFVSPVALQELVHLGLQNTIGFEESNVIKRAALYLNGVETLCRPFPSRPNRPSYGRVIPRKQLDQWMIDAAKAASVRVIEGARLKGYTVEPSGVRLELLMQGQPFCLTASLLLGADGSSSAVARQLHGHRLNSRDRIVAVRGYYEGVSGPSDRADIYFNAASLPGYFWIFPTGPATANVGVGLALDLLPHSEVHLQALFQDLIESDPAIRARLEGARLVGKVSGWPLATYNPTLAVHGERVMLLGDAANLINPINGEGIQAALLSARWAAETALAAIHSGDASAQALEPYARRVEKELRCDMALSCFLVQCIRNRVLNPIWLEAITIIADRARFDTAYGELASGILAGVVPASDALGPRMLLGTAAQSLTQLSLAIVEAVFQGREERMATLSDLADLSHNIVGSIFENPSDWLHWLLDLTRCATELITQTSSRLVPTLHFSRSEFVLAPSQLSLDSSGTYLHQYD